MASDIAQLTQATCVEDALRACASSDQTALKLIFDDESARMLGVAHRMLKRRALAEEAVQDTFVLIWRHAARFDPERGAGLTWIYAILRNRSLAILRDEKRTELRDRPVCPSSEHLAQLAA